MLKLLVSLCDQGLIPDILIRFGIRLLLKQRLALIEQSDEDLFYQKLSNTKLAYNTREANQQHYEVPTNYFKYVLGSKLKYSSCLFQSEENLDQAEIQMLDLYEVRGELKDGQHILELGCGWGSACLHFAKKFPNSKITAVSNSNSQREYINNKCLELNLTNLNVITCDINTFEPQEKFDRIISIEMFEHLRNYEDLFLKISNWINPNGKIFVHIFCHQKKSYLFEAIDDSDWMAKYFFTGGMMPAKNLFSRFNKHLNLINDWDVNGINYSKTAEAWYNNHLNHKSEILKIFKEVYQSEYLIWFQRWKIFYLACAELFKYNQGQEWFVSHYLFEKK